VDDGSEQGLYGSGEYVERNPTYHVEDSPLKARYILEMVRRHRLDVRTVCEVGCGAGEILRQLQQQLPQTEFHGYDISPQAFAISRERENERLRFHHQDLLETPTEVFDLLLCIDVFEHVEDYMGFLRALRPRARRQIFHIPLEMTAQWVLRSRPLLLGREQVGHLHYFMKETALATLGDTGYEVLDWLYTPTGIANPRSLKARLAALPRKALSLVNQDLTARILGGYSLLVLTK
jgi:hypothetical protein